MKWPLEVVVTSWVAFFIRRVTPAIGCLVTLSIMIPSILELITDTSFCAKAEKGIINNKRAFKTYLVCVLHGYIFPYI